jgi:hypothetical protein
LARTRSYSGVHRSGISSARGLIAHLEATPQRQEAKRGVSTCIVPNRVVSRRERRSLIGRRDPHPWQRRRSRQNTSAWNRTRYCCRPARVDLPSAKVSPMTFAELPDTGRLPLETSGVTTTPSASVTSSRTRHFMPSPGQRHDPVHTSPASRRSPSGSGNESGARPRGRPDAARPEMEEWCSGMAYWPNTLFPPLARHGRKSAMTQPVNARRVRLNLPRLTPAPRPDRGRSPALPAPREH